MYILHIYEKLKIIWAITKDCLRICYI